VAEAARLLLQGGSPDLELIVIDQSDGEETSHALSPLRSDRRLRYVRTKKRGKGHALNEGMELASNAIVVFTDDDCLAPPGWVAAMTSTLHAHPDAMVLFCTVAPVPHDTAAGYVPCYTVRRDRKLRSARDICGGMGLGAGMAVRSAFVKSVGGFDASFGPGGEFPSADDWDIAMRALLMGHAVYETAGISILHDGFRTLEQGRAHVRRDWLALGAVCAKPLRAGHWTTVVVPVWLFSFKAAWPILCDLFALRRPRGIGRITAFIRGFMKGITRPVDRKTLRFGVAPHAGDP
jgi:GT2 family glycosyltransferase